MKFKEFYLMNNTIFKFIINTFKRPRATQLINPLSRKSYHKDKTAIDELRIEIKSKLRNELKKNTLDEKMILGKAEEIKVLVDILKENPNAYTLHEINKICISLIQKSYY